MKRSLTIITAITVSNLAAWILFIVASPLLLFIRNGAETSWDAALFMVMVMISFGYIYFLIAFPPLSIVMALIGLSLRFHSLRACITGGALAGLGFHLVFIYMFGPEESFIFASGTPIGAICGWIYWRIAIKPTSPNNHAI